MGRLYKTINRILGDEVVRTLPVHNDENVLAEEIGNYFSTKIDKIHQDLSSKRNCFANLFQSDPVINQDLPTLDRFDVVREDELSEIIQLMPNKENLFDPLPITVVKINLFFFLPLELKCDLCTISVITSSVINIRPSDWLLQCLSSFNILV